MQNQCLPDAPGITRNRMEGGLNSTRGKTEVNDWEVAGGLNRLAEFEITELGRWLLTVK